MMQVAWNMFAAQYLLFGYLRSSLAHNIVMSDNLMLSEINISVENTQKIS